MAESSAPTIIHLNAPTHLPIKLTATNFMVWCRQLHSTLIGFDLLGYIDGTMEPPSPFLDAVHQTINPSYAPWHRQDQIIVAAIPGSCVDTIQPHISTVATAREAWNHLQVLFANSSRSRIMSLKESLISNSQGTRSISEFLQEMKTISDDLALAGHPVHAEDLVLHILTNLGSEFNDIKAAIRARETPISYAELFDKLEDFERQLKKDNKDNTTLLVTANYTNKQPLKNAPFSSSGFGRSQSRQGWSPSNSSGARRFGNNGQRWNSQNHGSTPRDNQRGPCRFNSNAFCNFCDRSGHDTKECRQLQRFLRDNNIGPPSASSPCANMASAVNPPTQQWLFDSAASHHTTSASNVNALQSYSDYGGPDEIILGNGEGSSHGGASVPGRE